jgi:hypothetical protein
MGISPFNHLSNQAVMTQEKCLELAPPPQGFRMSGIPLLALRQYGPNGMQLSMFA